MNRPTFMILGGPKCGTTSLGFYLGQHPDVYMSSPKEPLFFESEYERGLDWYWQRYFSGWQGQRHAGEARVFHLYLPFVVPRIRESLPGVKLVAVLRNPVDRAYSHWWHRHSRGQERLGFADAIEENLEQLQQGRSFEGPEGALAWSRGLKRRRGGSRHRCYVDVGHYAEQIERYRTAFGAELLELVLFEDLARNPIAVTRRLWKFLGLDPDARVADTRPQNVSRDVVQNRRSALLTDLYAASPLPRLVPEALKRSLRGLLLRPAAQPPASRQERLRLREHFLAPNRRLEDLLGRDLSTWNELS